MIAAVSGLLSILALTCLSGAAFAGGAWAWARYQRYPENPWGRYARYALLGFAATLVLSVPLLFAS